MARGAHYDLQCESGEVTKVDCTHAKRKLGIDLLETLKGDLELAKLEATCYMCPGSPQCPISPRAVKEFRDMYWVDGSGSCCQQYSKMNQVAAGELSMDALTCLVYVYSLRYYEPDQVLHECVPGFDLSAFFDPLVQRSLREPPSLRCQQLLAAALLRCITPHPSRYLALSILEYLCGVVALMGVRTSCRELNRWKD